MKIAYARVSSYEQNLDRQIDKLVEYGVDFRNIYKEKITGTARNRPELDRMLAELQQGDEIVVDELSRISRSTKDLLEIVEQIQAKGANIKSLKESWLDTTTPQGNLMFTIFAGLAQFERDLISQRTKEGLRAANARGRFGGRPPKITKKAIVVEVLYQKGMKISEIVKVTELSRSSVYRIINNLPKLTE
ncbi:MAG: recombinase family protein [Turicibacter sp.]|nr:recombinase family protein [Turicibacter sp.]